MLKWELVNWKLLQKKSRRIPHRESKMGNFFKKEVKIYVIEQDKISIYFIGVLEEDNRKYGEK